MNKIKWPLVILALGVACACGGGGSSNGNTNPGLPPPTATVSGVVQFQGRPLAGAKVTCYNTNTNQVLTTVQTDANGAYTIAGLGASGNVPSDDQFWVQKAGYGFYPSAGAGAGVTRMGYNGMFRGNNVDDVAISFTVIDYIANAAAPLTTADFNAFNATNHPVTLASTGQTAVFAPGDDGSSQKGIQWQAPRFVDQGDGTVLDKLTGLIWLRNAGYFAPTTWPQALAEVNQLATGTAGLTDGSKAGDWRVPNLVELESMVDVSASSPAVTAGNPFTQVANATYWTSTSYWGGSLGSPWAWIINLEDGAYLNDGVANVKAVSRNAVWAVKGQGGGFVKLQATGQYDGPFGDGTATVGDDGSIQSGVPLTYPRWIDNSDGTVTDSVTGLVWLKQADAFNLSWAGALTAISTLQSGQCGLSDGSKPGDWRMPNRKEMQSMADRFMNNHSDFFNATFTTWAGVVYQEPIFNSFVTAERYWTSSTDAADTTQAWAVYSCDFGVYNTPKANLGYSLAVR